MRPVIRNRVHERGQTLLLVVVAMSVLLGMAALAIDIATLYTAHNEARRAAEAAALAGAQAIASSSFTSGWLTDSAVCSGSVASPGLAEQRALAVVAQNAVAGGAATLLSTTCTIAGTPPRSNPRFTVNVQRTGLPTFFGRIFGGFPASATVSATAEAYNPSGSSSAPIAVGSVKPWAIPNCDPTHSTPANPACGTAIGGGSIASFVGSSGGIANLGANVGQVFDLIEIQDGTVTTRWASAGSPPNIQILAVDVPISAASVSCPAPGSVSCVDGSLQPASPGFRESIACANSTTVSYQGASNSLNVHSGSGSFTPHLTNENAALCLIHANTVGRNQGQDEFCNNAPLPFCSSASPISITGGSLNPDPLLQGKDNISRSDSVVTVPLFNPCGLNCPNGTVTVVGFLQLGIARVRVAGPLRAIIVNVVGRSTGAPPAVSGGGASPIPVRLVQ